MTLARALDADQRADALEQLGAGELDVLVVGGGIVGVGAALDAVTRGLKVGLRRAARPRLRHVVALVQAGPRRAALPGDVRLRAGQGGARGARSPADAARARTSSARCRSSTRSSTAWERPYVGAGVALYDAMAMTGKYDMGVPKHKHIFRKQLARMAPDIRTEDLHGAIRYYDCQVDDARLVMTIARTAANNGAHVATRTKVTGFLREGDRWSARACTTSRATARSRSAPRSSSTPPGSGPTRCRTSSAGRRSSTSTPARASTSSCPRTGSAPSAASSPRPRSRCCSSSRGACSGSSARPTPRGTSTSPTRRPARPTSTTSSATSTRLLKDPLDHDDVVGVYAGLRPLLKAVKKQGESNGGETTKLSREHTVANPVPGLVLVAGGKLTTYRVMARDAVDHAIRDFDTTPPSHHRPGAADGRVGLRGAQQPAGRAQPVVGDRHRHGRPPPRPLRRPGRRGAGAGARATRPGGAAARRGALPARGGALRRHARGGAPPRRRARASHARLDRDLRPRHHCGPAGGAS